ncbi:hypothetical protein RHSIM_Rhsim02G0160700 [Rhododendron simsii]|uniref:Retrotransposon gag domain-containing protein n=1 Tax=Rhododendron simsii TaxID=118357 RepID=A0A834LT97_RHOSS|nr:hypothetical protein RHSIM_Rhsim02G0160700 [Rhododendron simsii]
MFLLPIDVLALGLVSNAAFFVGLEQLVALTAARGAPQHQNPHSRRVNAESGDDVESEDGDNPFAVLRPQRKELAVVPDTFRRWESGFKLDIPEFKGCSQPDEFLDWVAAVEEILEFKEVPLDKRVSLVATKFRGRAAAWWQQLKQTRERQGKEKIRSWEKLLKHMRASFLPHNYTRSLYQQLQNLRQGSKSVDDYTQEFYQLLARNDLSESQDQLVSRYIGVMREQFQDALNFYDPVSVSEAHQKALTLEKQAGRKSGFQSGNITGSRPIPLVNNQTTIGKPLAAGQANRAPINSNTARYFNTKIVLVPSKEVDPKPTKGKGSNLLARKFMEDAADSGLVYVLIGKECAIDSPIPESARPMHSCSLNVFNFMVVFCAGFVSIA